MKANIRRVYCVSVGSYLFIGQSIMKLSGLIRLESCIASGVEMYDVAHCSMFN